MTQVVGLEFVVTGEREAKAALKSVSDAQSRLSRDILRGADRVKALGSEWEKANRYLKEGTINSRAHAEVQKRLAREYAILNGMVKSNGALNTQAAMRQMKAASEASAAAAKSAKSARDAADAERALATEKLRLEAMYNKTATATRVFEQAQMSLNRALELNVIDAAQHKAQMEQLQSAYQRVGQSSAQASMFINQFGEGARVGGIKTNRFGMVAQQVGYQVGDFFVQIQSGTNAFVAFGQQATQLAGLLPGLAGAIVGIGISVGTMLLSAWDRTRKAQDEAAKSVSNLDDKLKALDSSLSEWVITKKAAAAGVTADEFIGGQGIDDAISKLEEAQKKLSFLRSGRGQFIRGAVGSIPFAESIFGLNISDAIADVNAAEEAVVSAEERVAQTRNRLNSENIDSLEEAIRLELQVLELRRVEQQFGASSIQFVRAKNQQELENLRIKLEQEAATGGVTEEEQRLIDAIISAKEQSLALSEVDVGKGVRKAVSDAVRLSAELGVSLRAAQMIADIRSPRKPNTITGFDPNDPRSRGAGAIDMAFDYGTTSPFDPSRNRDRRTGGGGGNVININEIIAARREQVEQERILIGLSGQRRMEEEIYFDLIKQNRDANIQLSDQQIRAAAQEIAAAQQINEVMEERRQIQEQLAQTIESSMETAFMSIVDGTKSAKDAFRDMARSIIAELYKVLVVQRLVGAISGAIGLGSVNANGNAFQGGNVIPFANGGVVGGPTTFPMAGGKTGLMGEAGPEAIMPLKRGKDGKLGVVAEGGGGSVVVNNNINVQGDNAAAVRAEVAKLMPTITQATKSAVIDARRRGGQMKAAFG